MGPAHRSQGFRRGATAFALAAGAALCLASSPAAAPAATTCSFNDATNTLNVGGDPEVGTALAVKDNEEIGVIHRHALGAGFISCAGPTPTTTNTDKVSVIHTTPDEATYLQINDPERFAPGTIDEPGIGPGDCPDEIEIEVDLGFGEDHYLIMDVDDSADTLAVDDEGLDWNPNVLCADRDVVFETFPYEVEVTAQVGVAPGAAPNSLTARGVTFTSEPLSRPLEYTGGTGPDEVIGGEGPDVIDGGAGGDILRGAEGDDQIIGGPGARDKLFGEDGLDWLLAEDGKRDRKIDCGPGANTSELASFDRRKDPPPKRC